MTGSRQDRERELLLKREKKIRLARGSLWEYCRCEAPTFYREDRWHLRMYAWVIQAVYEGSLTKESFRAFCEGYAPRSFIDSFDWDRLIEGHVYKRLITNLPPQHGKSRTLVNGCKWIFGQNPDEKIITGSYNDNTAGDFSKYTRDGIKEEKNQPHDIDYSDIFPDTSIKGGDAAAQKWALEGQHFSYLGAGVGGSITSKGGSILIIDDPIKDADTALNETALDKIWLWYTGTFLSRVSAEGGEPIEIVNMTRWSKLDICGRLLEGPEANEWFVLRLQARDEQGNMLCPALLNEKRYFSLKGNMPDMIFEANYHQQPVDVKGKLYKTLKTYSAQPAQFERIINYTDTADEGVDWLCSIVAGVYQGEGYVLDVYYTQEGMEVTEPETALLLKRNNVSKARIESNNGGKGFARNVKRILWDDHKIRIPISWFHQSKNKMARILTSSAYVMEHIYFPENWKDRWPEFCRDLNGFQKEGKNKHDDAADTITGIAEVIQNKGLHVLE